MAAVDCPHTIDFGFRHSTFFFICTTFMPSALGSTLWCQNSQLQNISSRCCFRWVSYRKPKWGWTLSVEKTFQKWPRQTDALLEKSEELWQKNQPRRSSVHLSAGVGITTEPRTEWLTSHTCQNGPWEGRSLGNCDRSLKWRAGETAQWLKALASLSEDSDSDPVANTGWLTTVTQLKGNYLMTSSGLFRLVCARACKHTHTHTCFPKPKHSWAHRLYT